MKDYRLSISRHKSDSSYPVLVDDLSQNAQSPDSNCRLIHNKTMPIIIGFSAISLVITGHNIVNTNQTQTHNITHSNSNSLAGLGLAHGFLIFF